MSSVPPTIGISSVVRIPDESKAPRSLQTNRFLVRSKNPSPPPANKPTRKRCESRETYLLVMKILAGLGALGGAGYLVFASVQHGIDANCTALSKLTNSTDTAPSCYLPEEQELIATECVNTLKLKPWAIAMAVANVATSIIAYFSLKHIINNCCRGTCCVDPMRRHPSLYTSSFKIYLIPYTFLLQLINAFAIPALETSDQNTGCLTFCNKNFSAVMCPQNMESMCINNCRSSDIFPFKWETTTLLAISTWALGYWVTGKTNEIVDEGAAVMDNFDTLTVK